jgi:hypothetical protein
MLPALKGTLSSPILISIVVETSSHGSLGYSVSTPPTPPLEPYKMEAAGRPNPRPTVDVHDRPHVADEPLDLPGGAQASSTTEQSHAVSSDGD